MGQRGHEDADRELAAAAAASLSTLAEIERTVARLERANAELWRENTRLARGALGQTGAAAAAQLARAERLWRQRAEAAEADAARLERQLGTPRHQAVENIRATAMRSRLVYAVVRRMWAWVSRP